MLFCDSSQGANIVLQKLMLLRINNGLTITALHALGRTKLPAQIKHVISKQHKIHTNLNNQWLTRTQVQVIYQYFKMVIQCFVHQKKKFISLRIATY